MKNGFTLIELSIVLVIIGLIVGGVLVGRDLIEAAAVLAQVAQIEKYNTAVNTFRTKFNCLPGDCSAGDAAQLGFTPRTGNRGDGDGDGIIEGWSEGVGYGFGFWQQPGETTQFWVDLTYANGVQVNLIEGAFNSGATTWAVSAVLGSAEDAAPFYPPAKIGENNYMYVWSGGPNDNDITGDGSNYFGLAAVSAVRGWMTASPGLSVQQAFNIDQKIDDGFPQTGRVTALYVNGNGVFWAGGGGTLGASPNTAAFMADTSCYDNDGAPNTPMQYSYGTNVNCALSFKFQ